MTSNYNPYIIRLKINIYYFFVRLFSKLSKFIERKCWNYEWCHTCHGEGLYPNSGSWLQPDGFRLCPDCFGDKWYHTSLTYKSKVTNKCYCYLRKGLKEQNLLITGYIKSGVYWFKIACPLCKRNNHAKKEWLAILRWNQLAYPKNIKFLEEHVYNE